MLPIAALAQRLVRPDRLIQKLEELQRDSLPASRAVVVEVVVDLRGAVIAAAVFAGLERSEGGQGNRRSKHAVLGAEVADDAAVGEKARFAPSAAQFVEVGCSGSTPGMPTGANTRSRGPGRTYTQSSMGDEQVGHPLLASTYEHTLPPAAVAGDQGAVKSGGSPARDVGGAAHMPPAVQFRVCPFELADLGGGLVVVLVALDRVDRFVWVRGRAGIALAYAVVRRQHCSGGSTLECLNGAWLSRRFGLP